MNSGGLKRPAYNFQNFYNDCKNHMELIEVETRAKDEAVNLLHLYGNKSIKEQILNYITNRNPDEFLYKNTEPYRKGSELDNSYHPDVDAYILPERWFDMYLAFYIQKTGTGWVIKSIHSDNSHSGNGDTTSLGDYLKLAGKLL